MIPSAWPAVVLALAAFRLTRLLGWDDLPPIARLRARAVGLKVVMHGSSNAVGGLTNEEPDVVVTYRRPLLHHFLSCPFCQGFWVSVVVYAAWRFEPTGTLYAAAPLALSAAVGLVAKNLDP